MGTLQGSWVWYELISPDPDGAKAFYEAVADWSIAIGVGPDGYGFVTAPDGAMVGGVMPLTEDMATHGARTGWFGYVGVDDVDAAIAAIEAAGGKCLIPARDVAMAGRIAMVCDPGGAAFYIMTPTPPPGGGESSAFTAAKNPGHCGWNELMAADAARELGFYSARFGWTEAGDMDMGPMGKYQFIANDGVTVGAIMPVMAETPAPMWNHFFWVPSITAAKNAVEANGGQVINGPMQVPGDDWIIMGVDPQGGVFALVGGQ